MDRDRRVERATAERAFAEGRVAPGKLVAAVQAEILVRDADRHVAPAVIAPAAAGGPGGEDSVEFLHRDAPERAPLADEDRERVERHDDLRRRRPRALAHGGGLGFVHRAAHRAERGRARFERGGRGRRTLVRDGKDDIGMVTPEGLDPGLGQFEQSVRTGDRDFSDEVGGWFIGFGAPGGRQGQGHDGYRGERGTPHAFSFCLRKERSGGL